MTIRPLAALLALSLVAPAPGSLDIYVVDTEGGKATLFVAPSGVYKPRRLQDAAFRKRTPGARTISVRSWSGR